MFDPPCSIEVVNPCLPPSGGDGGDSVSACSASFVCPACCHNYLSTHRICEDCLRESACPDPCESFECGAHGECRLKGSGVVCVCQEGFEGDRCETKTRPANVCAAISGGETCNVCDSCCKKFLKETTACDACVQEMCIAGNDEEEEEEEEEKEGEHHDQDGGHSPAPTPASSDAGTSNVCDPTAGCNVCDECCKTFLGNFCDVCVEDECERDGGTNDDDGEHPCDGKQCGAHGVCDESGTCECDEGYGGTFCQDEIAEQSGENDETSGNEEVDDGAAEDPAAELKEASSERDGGNFVYVLMMGSLVAAVAIVYYCFVKPGVSGSHRRSSPRHRRHNGNVTYSRVDQRDAGVELGTWDEINKLGPAGVSRDLESLGAL
eukprot:g1019.t1